MWELHVQQSGTVPIRLLSADWWLNLFLSVFTYMSIHYYITMCFCITARDQNQELGMAMASLSRWGSLGTVYLHADPVWSTRTSIFLFPPTWNQEHETVMTLNFWALLLSRLFSSTVVSCKYTPPFCNPSLSTKWRGEGLYAGCDNFSRNYALPSGIALPHCQWGVGPKREAERCSRR